MLLDELMQDIIYSSVKNLFKNQPDIFVNTSYTNFTEWNLSYHLSNEIAKYIFWLNVDLDVTKRNYHNRRPDIIFHSRNSNALNFLVVELKKSSNDNQSDLNKLKMDWMRHPLQYRYGLYINIWGFDKYKARLLVQGGKEYELNKYCNYIQLPYINNQVFLEYRELIEHIKCVTNNRSLNQCLTLLDRKIIETYKSNVSVTKDTY